MLSAISDKRHSGFRATKRLLGRILVDGGFVGSHELQVAVERQRQTNDQLGEILVGMGVLDPLELKAVLSIQKDLATPDDAVKVAAGVRLLLGELLLKAKRLTQEQIDIALREQMRTGEKLGEVFVRLGLLIEHERDAALAFQRHQSGEASASEKLRLGEILVATGQITREQLEDVLNRQKLSKKKIGELLVEAGYVQPHQVDSCLRLQQKLVTAALVAALSLSNALGAQKAHAGSQGTASAKVAVTATVREHTRLSLLSQAQELIVTNVDIRRGYVDVPSASRINVKSNNPAGYLLVFDVMEVRGIISGVNVTVGGKDVLIPPGGGWIPQPYIRGGTIVDVSYRFILSENAQPGTYNWPLMVSASPL